ncbi:hypothetical protein [Pseudolysinimonas sp.]|uniref:hypothetical protein n=1 Tax=Pseudolysinimonas sp. TaxID=2680009 RepID=UPI003F7E523C
MENPNLTAALQSLREAGIPQDGLDEAAETLRKLGGSMEDATEQLRKLGNPAPANDRRSRRAGQRHAMANARRTQLDAIRRETLNRRGVLPDAREYARIEKARRTIAGINSSGILEQLGITPVPSTATPATPELQAEFDRLAPDTIDAQIDGETVTLTKEPAA